MAAGRVPRTCSSALPTSSTCRGAKGRTAICRASLIGDPTACSNSSGRSLATLVAATRSRQRLIIENLLLRQQLQVALRSRRRSRFRSRDKLFWLLVRRLHRDWRRHLLLVRPETVLGWHRQGWRLFWRWRSGSPLGRPRLNAGVRELIATMAREKVASNCNSSSTSLRSRVDAGRASDHLVAGFFDFG